MLGDKCQREADRPDVVCYSLIYFKPIPLLDPHKMRCQVCYLRPFPWLGRHKVLKSPGLSFEILSIVRQTSDASHARPSVSPPQLIIRGHADSIYCAVFSVDGKQIVSGSKDRTIRIWDAQTGNPDLTLLEMHTVGVSSVAFSPNRRQIASSSKDATILVWHVLTGEVVAGPFKGHTDSISSVCFSPDGKRIASSSSDMTIRDAQTGNPLVDPLRGHTNRITSVVFSGDDTCITSGANDQTVRVRDAMLGRLVLGHLKGRKNWGFFCGILSDSKRIISAPRFGDGCLEVGSDKLVIPTVSIRWK